MYVLDIQPLEYSILFYFDSFMNYSFSPIKSACKRVFLIDRLEDMQTESLV
jgi:hypothetical protein